MFDIGAAVAAMVGVSGVIGFIIRLVWTALTKSIEQNRQDRLHSIEAIWARLDKVQDELHREYVRMEYLREMEQRMIVRIDEIRVAISEMRQELRRNPNSRDRLTDQDDGK